MSQSEKPFSVSDRRHFTPEGRPRDEGSPDEPAVAAPDGTNAPSSGAGKPEAVGDAPGTPEGAEPVSLAQFLVSLGAQAGMLLSEAAQPDAGKPAGALAGARSIISILEMLKDKTEGRRTPEEDRVIEGLLFELRMGYVECGRAGKS